MVCQVQYPGVQPRRYHALLNPVQRGPLDEKTVAVDMKLRFRRPHGLRGGATKGVVRLLVWKILHPDRRNVAYLGSYHKRVTTVRTILRQVLMHPVQEGLAAFFMLRRKARDLIIDRFGISLISSLARDDICELMLEAWVVLYFVVVLRQAQAPACEPTGAVRQVDEPAGGFVIRAEVEHASV